ncbi:D-alanyl-D-alanine carboxypeptidase/D-alanyl-D-alanine-endopeptidase [Gemmatimonas sp.]|uniref:D-alanyl-D-alanine carboxypeptidase/D-alanyl-D-alanine endopeptidase n=1 Tax=Gemmatimonas sp. TaxID=1962908 RepID=UPI00333F3DD2
MKTCGLALAAMVAVPTAPCISYAAVVTTSVQQARKRPPARTPSTKKKPAKRSTRATKARVRTPVVPVLRYTTPRGASALASDLGTLLGSRTKNGDWGAMVVSITRGDTLFAQGPGAKLVPASTMKLFTAAIALEKLGPEHTFSTDVLRDGTIDPDGTLKGNLVLRGDGDPSLSPRFVRGGPGASMTLLAQFVAGAGIKRVTGDIIADASGFESRRIPEGWLTRYAGAGYAAPFSALSLNENIVIVGIAPGGSGGAANVFLEPATEGLTITNTVRTVAGGGTRISARRIGDDRVVVSGTIGARAGTARYQLVVGDPVTFTAGAFKSALEAQGITVAGDIKVGRTPQNAPLVTSLPSPPLARLVSVMNRESINIFAELLFRNAARGLDHKTVGSAENAAQTLQQFLTKEVGASADAVSATDGSGLSVLDRVTPRALVQLLGHAHHAPWGSAFHASLPVAGESELLRNRMRATPAQGNLHAKTGTTNDVIGLSGYVTAENGEILAFAFLYNGRDRWHARETIDAMGPTLAAFSRD